MPHIRGQRFVVAMSLRCLAMELGIEGVKTQPNPIICRGADASLLVACIYLEDSRNPVHSRLTFIHISKKQRV